MVKHTRFPWAEEGKLIVAEGSKQKQMENTMYVNSPSGWKKLMAE